MMTVPIKINPLSPAGAPKILFEGAYVQYAATRGYDVTPDGRRFLMVQPKDRPAHKPRHMILVQNWVEELKRRVPTN
jgi:hypothetical protein